MELKDAISIAKKYFENQDIPKTTREWRMNCPPELTAGKINSLPFTVGDILRAVNPNARTRSKSVEYDPEALGLGNLTFTGTKATFICGKCLTEQTAERSTILIWHRKGSKYCSSCRGATGAIKSPSYYKSKLPKDYEVLEVLSNAGNTKCVVQHLACGSTRVYSSRHILQRDTLSIECSVCDGKGGFDSIHEKEVITHLCDVFPDLRIEVGIPYKDLITTNRRWTLDVYIEELNLCIEITTKGNGFEGYFSNLKDKLRALEASGYITEVVYSKTGVEDIVRSLLKDKE